MWEECRALQEYIVGLRRDLHQIPEVGKDLPETSAYVAAELDKIGIPYVRSDKDSGILAVLPTQRNVPGLCCFPRCQWEQKSRLFCGKGRSDRQKTGR